MRVEVIKEKIVKEKDRIEGKRMKIDMRDIEDNRNGEGIIRRKMIRREGRSWRSEKRGKNGNLGKKNRIKDEKIRKKEEWSKGMEKIKSVIRMEVKIFEEIESEVDSRNKIDKELIGMRGKERSIVKILKEKEILIKIKGKLIKKGIKEEEKKKINNMIEDEERKDIEVRLGNNW